MIYLKGRFYLARKKYTNKDPNIFLYGFKHLQYRVSKTLTICIQFSIVYKRKYISNH